MFSFGCFWNVEKAEDAFDFRLFKFVFSAGGGGVRSSSSSSVARQPMPFLQEPSDHDSVVMMALDSDFWCVCVVC